MTGSHRSVVRVLTMSALITSIWIAAARSAQAQSPVAVVGAGQVLPAGTGWIVAARSTASGTPHPSFTVSGHF